MFGCLKYLLEEKQMLRWYGGSLTEGEVVCGDSRYMLKLESRERDVRGLNQIYHQYHRLMVYVQLYLLACVILLVSKSFSSTVVTLDATTFFSGINKDDSLVLVDFYAPWCTTCGTLSNTLDRVASELNETDMTIAKFDATETRNVKFLKSKEIYFFKFPTLYLYKYGQKLTEYAGNQSVDDIVSFLVQSSFEYQNYTVPYEDSTNNTEPSTVPAAMSSIGIFPPVSFLYTPDSATADYLCNATGFSFLYNETVDVKSNTRTIVTNSCPNHFSICQSEECGGDLPTRALIQRKVYTVPLYPGFAETSTLIDLTCTSEVIGIALNGVGIYGMSDSVTRECTNKYNVPLSATAAYGRTKCGIQGHHDSILQCGDVVRKHGKSFDRCSGYEDHTGSYKYHTVPSCLLSQLSSNSVNGHSPQIGWALDGYPIFGSTGPKHITMMPCGVVGAHPQLCLDACNGYYGRLPGYDNYLYRYYMPGEVANGNCSSTVTNGGTCTRYDQKCCASTVPRSVFKPYTLGCYRGCPVGDSKCKLSGVKGTTDAYIPTVSLHAMEVYPSYDLPTPTNNDTGTVKVSRSSSNTTSTSRLTAVQNPFTRQISLFNTTSYSTITTEVTATTIDGHTTIASKETTSPVVTVTEEPLATSLSDAFITGMVRDYASKVLYYTTQSAIHAYDETKQVTTSVVPGLYQITIIGFNLGASLQDVRYIKVRNSYCTSLYHVNDTMIRCILVHSQDSFTSGEVTLSTIGGTIHGTYIAPQVVVRSGSGRPVASEILIEQLPFQPYALSLLVQKNDAGGLEKTLYWSNVAEGAFSIMRCRTDGTYIETVVSNVQKAVNLHVFSALIDSSMSLLSVVESGTITDTTSVEHCTRLRSPSSDVIKQFNTSSINVDVESIQSNCSTAAHLLFFMDANQATLTKVTLLPINKYNIMVPASVSTLQDQLMYSSYVDQETSLVVSDYFKPLVLLRGLTNPRGFSFDLPSKMVFVTVADGLMFKLSLDFMLAATVDTFTVIGSASTASSATNDTVTNSTRLLLSDSVQSEISVSGGVVDTTGVSSSTSSSNATAIVIANVLTDQQPVLNLNELMRSSQARLSLPSWIELLSTSYTKSRLSGITVSSLTDVTPDSSNVSIHSWEQQRILYLDSNQQHLYATSDAGHAPTSLDLGLLYGIVWPSQIMYLKNIHGGDRLLSAPLNPIEPVYTSNPTFLPTYYPTASPTTSRPTRSPTLAPTTHPTFSENPTEAPTLAPTTHPTFSEGPTTAPTEMPTFVPTESPTRVPSVLPSLSPSVAPTVAPTLAPSHVPTESPTTRTPTIKPSAKPTVIPSRSPTIAPTFVPTTRPSRYPTIRPSSRDPTVWPSRKPTVISAIPTTPSIVPTALPSTSSAPSTHSPSEDPSIAPSRDPSLAPSIHPSLAPSNNPSAHPSMDPSIAPSVHPTTTHPSISPSTAPSVHPSLSPSENPSTAPSIAPTYSMSPTTDPSVHPSMHPTDAPSIAPSASPSTMMPSTAPSLAPSRLPSFIPTTTHPSYRPTLSPSAHPSVIPTRSPSTRQPTAPTRCPTYRPTFKPTFSMMPSYAPTYAPTFAPTPVVPDSSKFYYYDVYISELLGRIWKLSLKRNVGTGEISVNENITPVVVIDKSNFPASSIIREKLAWAKSNGIDASAVVFNEIY